MIHVDQIRQKQNLMKSGVCGGGGFQSANYRQQHMQINRVAYTPASFE